MSKILLSAIDIGMEFELKKDQGICEGGTCTGGYSSIGAFISSLLPNAFVVAGLILFFLILFAGFTMIMAGGDSEKLSQGKKTLTAALAGFALIFASYWIIKIIEVITGIKIF